MSKSTFVVTEGNTIKHDGEKYEAGAEIQLTEEEAKKLHVESAEQAKARRVLAGKDNYSEADSPKPMTKQLVEKINAATSIETVIALGELSDTKSVKAAVDKKLKSLSSDIEVMKNDLLKHINEASDLTTLESYAGSVSGCPDEAAHKELSEAYAAKEKELGG